MHGLAELSTALGKYEQAELLYQRALQLQEHVSGADHPDRAYFLNGLGDLYAEQGRYEQAKNLLQRALVIREQQLGPEHPETAETLAGLAAFALEAK